MIRAQLLSPGTSPHELAGRTDALRSEATDRVLARLPERKHDEFRRIVGELAGYVTVREGRAYWHMVLTGEVRLLALRMGSSLVREGRLDRADDILFLTPDDYEDRTVGDLRSLVAERRADWERWCDVVPPQIIGRIAGMTPTPAPAGVGELRGAAASRVIRLRPPSPPVEAMKERPSLSSGASADKVSVPAMVSPALLSTFGCHPASMPFRPTKA